MQYTASSVYPEGIDPLIFYQDCDYDHKGILGEYYQLIINNHFEQAAELMHNSDIDYYGAWLLNMIEDRLRTTEENIDVWVDAKPILTIRSATPPSNHTAHWVGPC